MSEKTRFGAMVLSVVMLLVLSWSWGMTSFVLIATLTLIALAWGIFLGFVIGKTHARRCPACFVATLRELRRRGVAEIVLTERDK